MAITRIVCRLCFKIAYPKKKRFFFSFRSIFDIARLSNIEMKDARLKAKSSLLATGSFLQLPHSDYIFMYVRMRMH